MGLTLSIEDFPGGRVVGWGRNGWEKLEIKANFAQFDMVLVLSLAKPYLNIILRGCKKKTFYMFKVFGIFFFAVCLIYNVSAGEF